MQVQIFLRISFTNRNIIEKYFRLNSLGSLSAKNDLLILLCRVGVEAHFPLKVTSIYLFRSLFRFFAVLSVILTVENKEALSANNLGLD